MNGRFRMIVATVASLAITSLVGYAAAPREGRAILTGKVYVTSDQGPRPVPGATVLLYNDAGVFFDRQTTTIDGVFRFERLLNGRYTIEAAKEGVGRGSARVTVREGFMSTITIMLRS